MAAIQGTPVAPGLALGPVHVVRARAGVVPTWSIRSDEVDSEIARLHDALALVERELAHRQEAVRRLSGEQDAGILGVHRMILQDPSAVESVETTVREDRINAEAAVQKLVRKLRSTMQQLDGEEVRGYAADMSEPWTAVLDVLLQRDREEIARADDPVVLAAVELTPQVATFLSRERILAIVTEVGGRFSHGAVLARSFGIPCVVGVPNLLTRLEQNMPVLVDGDNGTVELRPPQESVDEFLVRRQRRATRVEALAAHAGRPAQTPDGHTMSVQVNMESIRDLGTFDTSHADGTGLLRTEFLYMERTEFPSEEEQYRLYRRVVEAMEGKPVTIRTLDIGGDKTLPYLETPEETNPALGWRGLRISLQWQDLLRVQLRAVMRASAHGPVRLLLPMVTSVEEVQAVQGIVDSTRAQLRDQGYDVADDIPIGVMVEVPSTIWILDELLEIVEFVSVGTNDLVQYILAVDRDNVFVSSLYEPHHPSVIRALSQIARAAAAAGKPAAVCGEIAGDEAMATLLMGLGFDALSVAPHFLDEIRHAIRATPLAEARELAQEAVRARGPVAVRAILATVRERLHERMVEAADSSEG